MIAEMFDRLRREARPGIGWHKDRPIYEHVMGVSLGVSASMRFRRPRGGRWERASSPLESRGIYHLLGPVRHDWEHSITEMDRTRRSITMRSFSDKGRRLAIALSQLAINDHEVGPRHKIVRTTVA